MKDNSEIEGRIFGFDKAAIYRIEVLGKISKDYFDRFPGMSLKHIDSGEKTITILSGKLPDQAALSGVMNELYDIHMSVLSVEKMN